MAILAIDNPNSTCMTGRRVVVRVIMAWQRE
jgi:hypothetical protein